MPDPVTHHVFGRQVLSQLPEEIREAVHIPIFDRSVQGPDPWSTIGFYGGKNKKYAVRSNIMHKSNAGLFLVTLANKARQDMTVPTFSVLAGVICHYCLDKLAHPYIICKGGEYDGTEETRALSGGHVRLERAIDSYYIRHIYGEVPWHFSIPARIMQLKRFPECLRPVMNEVYREVYGWDDSFDLINTSLRYERQFYGLMQDPLGLVHMLLRPVSGGKTNYCIYSFYRRDTDSKVLDYLNENHIPWHHPFDPSIVSTASFFELFEQAKLEAVSMLQAVYGWISQDEKISLEDVFGNCNYATGFDCDDPRNLAKPVCEPLMYGDKYWNKGKER